jgi:uncharacterized protein YraI
MRSISRLIYLGLVVVLLAASLVMFRPAMVYSDDATAPQATTQVATRVRSGPGLDYTQISVLDPQVTVPVFGRSESSQWLYVQYGPGSFGWIAAWIVTLDGDLASIPVTGSTSAAPTGPTESPTIPAASPTPSAPPDPAVVPAGAVDATTLARVNLRPRPGTDNTPITVIPEGVAIAVNGRTSDSTWLSVYFIGQNGWVAASLVSLSGVPVSDLPVVDPESGGAILPTSPQQPPIITPMGSMDGATVQITGVGQHTREIFEHGQALGNYPHRFTRVGDSEMALPVTLTGFDANYYYLGTWGNLEDTIQFFHGSFNRPSQAAMAGLPITALIDPFWADPKVCLDGENSLECEYRLFRPSVALILLRIHGNYENWLELYEADMRIVIETSIDYGVIPVLTLQFKFRDYPAAADEMNVVIRRLGEEYQVPVWDLYSSTVNLPDNGVDPTNHLTVSPYNNFDFSNTANLQYGKVVHNLEALQILDILMHQVILQQ